MKIDLAALLTAIVGLVTLYFHWRSSRASERELELRMKNSEELILRVEAERKTRETQIMERLKAEETLRASQNLGDFSSTVDRAHAVLERQLSMYQQFAMLYILTLVPSAKTDPQMHQHARDLCCAILNWHIVLNSQAMLLKQLDQLTPDESQSARLAKLKDLRNSTYDEAIAAGLALMKAIEGSDPPVLEGLSAMQIESIRDLVPNMDAVAKKFHVRL